jgi:hypothetical protein
MQQLNKDLKVLNSRKDYDQSFYYKMDSYMMELDYLEKVRAHRMYQYAMSRYKLMRYTPENVK